MGMADMAVSFDLGLSPTAIDQRFGNGKCRSAQRQPELTWQSAPTEHLKSDGVKVYSRSYGHCFGSFACYYIVPEISQVLFNGYTTAAWAVYGIPCFIRAIGGCNWAV